MASSATHARGSGTLVFDGDCRFCTTSAGWMQRVAPDVTIVPWQFADLDGLGVEQSAAETSVQYVDARGAVSGGAAAIARLLISRGGLAASIGRVTLVPGISAVAEAAYKVVAKNRHRLPGGTPACKLGPQHG